METSQTGQQDEANPGNESTKKLLGLMQQMLQNSKPLHLNQMGAPSTRFTSLTPQPKRYLENNNKNL